MTTKVCKACGQEKTAIQKGLRKNGSYNYVDESDRVWFNKRCPDCAKLYWKEKNSTHKGHKPLEERDCPGCSKHFKQSNYKQTYCTATCRKEHS